MKKTTVATKAMLTQQKKRISARSGAMGPQKKRPIRGKGGGFQKKYNQSQGGSYWTNFIIFGGLAICLITIIIMFLSARSRATTQPPFDINEINEKVNEAKKTIIVQPKQATPPANTNAVKITFRLYATPTCDESDPSKFLTITKESSVKHKQNITIPYISLHSLSVYISLCIDPFY